MIELKNPVSWGLGLILFSSSAFATILPPNNLWIYDSPNKNSNITEALFNQIVDQAVTAFQPLAQMNGVTLEANKEWNDSTVNASAWQDETAKKWMIDMYGGLARREEVTPDGFALVVCHELGHHFGGFPQYPSSRWAASEGQSDYFATQACARKLWRSDYTRNAEAALTVNPVAKEKCDLNWNSTESRNLCYRVANAGMSLALLLANLGTGQEPRFDTPDTTQVSQTRFSHPNAQCRLDTYFYGGLCRAGFDLTQIPGKNHPSGVNTPETERVASFASCHLNEGFLSAARPRCWFKPQL